MKRILVYLLITLVFLQSCGTGEEPTRTSILRTINNNSQYTVQFEIIGDQGDSYFIDPGDSLVLEGYCLNGVGTGYCIAGWDNIDTVIGRIVFNDEKELRYQDASCETGANPFGQLRLFNSCGYSERFNGTIREYVYVFDDNDYENAEPID
jgi:hypothetical protein